MNYLEQKDKAVSLTSKGYLYNEVINQIELVSLTKEEVIEIKKQLFPDSLFYLVRSYIRCRTHLEENKKDGVSTRQLVAKKSKVIRELLYLSRKNNKYLPYLKEFKKLEGYCQKFLIRKP